SFEKIDLAAAAVAGKKALEIQSQLRQNQVDKFLGSDAVSWLRDAASHLTGERGHTLDNFPALNLPKDMGMFSGFGELGRGLAGMWGKFIEPMEERLLGMDAPKMAGAATYGSREAYTDFANQMGGRMGDKVLKVSGMDTMNEKLSKLLQNSDK